MPASPRVKHYEFVDVDLWPGIEYALEMGSKKRKQGVHQLSVFEKNLGGDVAELISAVEAGNLENKQVSYNLALELMNKVGRSLRGTTRGNDIVNDEDLLALANGVFLHLEEIRAILLAVLGSDTGSRELALLANGGKGNAEAEGEARTEQEAAGIKADDNIRLGLERLGDLQLEGVDEGGMGGWVGEEGHNIDEVDTRNREVGEAAQRLAQAYLCTGEFGGTGGGGGGLSSRGILAGGGGRRGDVCRGGWSGGGDWLLGAHCGERKKRRGRRRRGREGVKVGGEEGKRKEGEREKRDEGYRLGKGERRPVARHKEEGVWFLDGGRKKD